jgi:hypothetical protein
METDANKAIGALEEAKALIEKEESIRKKMQLLRWGFPLLVLAIFGTYAYLLYDSVRSVEEDKFFARLQQNLTRIWPVVGDEIKRVGKELYPFYAEEFQKAVVDAAPELEKKFSTEMKAMQSTFETRMSQDMTRMLAEAHQQQVAILTSEIPEVADDPAATNRVITAINAATVTWMKDLFSAALQEHAVAFLDLKKVLDKNYRLADEEKGKVDAEQLLSLWLEVVDDSMSGETLIKPDKAKR